MTTIKQVAKFAGVSTATVSRVLNNANNVREETKRRVEKAIDTLNYEPNDVARALYKGRSKMIALFVPDIMNPFYPELARGVEDVTNRHGYTFVLGNTDDDHDKEKTYRDALRQKKVDGIIIVSSSLSKEEAARISIPAVMLDRKIATNLSSITVNNQEGAREAVQYLKSIGCQRIAHISGPDNERNAINRRNGFLDEVKHEDWFTTEYIISGDYDFETGIKAAKRLLAARPEIDGLFVANDLMGVGALKAAHDLGIQVPGSLSVVGFDGIMLGETTTPSLTTMAQPIYDMGVCAAEMLLNQIEKDETNIQTKEFPVRLKVGESTRKGVSD